jgi:hypothetical protein
MHRYFSLFMLVALGSASVLLTNGDFEQDLSIGWTSMISGQLSTDTIDRATNYDPDPDYEVRVKKYDAAYAKVSQTVDIPTTDLQFAVDCKLYAHEYDPLDVYWATAAVVLYYLDAGDNLLGQTRICFNSPHTPYTNSNVFHMIEVPSSTEWYDYSFNVNDELDNLSGIDAADIAKIEVALYDTTDGC